ncbi:hypothetical protein IB236_13185 [Acidovorax sp. ACV02]|uniref:hypothetical protein n=1 Tax=Acidovorax sp. ACV02 TaxID=2769310 RepID=UPI00177D67CD|nr:hypothetical protein [Acidovorax sp. ACV02]MBD9406296.1 hypothetical protein [Acidovorax sp. ACV02]
MEPEPKDSGSNIGTEAAISPPFLRLKFYRGMKAQDARLLKFRQEESTMSATSQHNPVAAFIAGEVPLARMFWLHGVVAGAAAGMALGGLRGISPELQQVWALLMFAYMLAWYIGLWRSAGRYTGPAIWRWAARAVVVMPFVGIVLTLVLSVGPKQEQRSAPIAQPAGSSAQTSGTDKEGKPCSQITEFLGECKRQP